MKLIVFVFLVAIGFIACKGNDKKIVVQGIPIDSADYKKSASDTSNPAPMDTANNTTIQWLDSTYLDLGTKKEGKEVPVSFRFKNTGTKNLIIQSVTAQCGCTIPEKPEKPIAPGEEGVINAKFNGSGHGETRKEVYVTANTSPLMHTLTFRANLEK
jgi:hypothetical protein